MNHNEQRRCPECAASTEQVSATEPDIFTPEKRARINDEETRLRARIERERERDRADRMSRRREYNPNSDKPVCQGGPRWYV